MITKLDIDAFGVFSKYVWKNEIKDDEKFQSFNLIFGKNYSGKTTLSRIFKCIENKQILDNFKDSKFRIYFSDQSELSSTELVSANSPYTVKVFNSDFVKENLSWLQSDTGTIQPITILGKKNIQIDQEIKEIDNQLGSIKEQVGLLYKAHLEEGNYQKMVLILIQIWHDVFFI